MKVPIIQIKDLTAPSNKKDNFINIKNFEIHRGACYLVNGQMGAGKTLLLDILTGNVKKYNGEILYEANSIKSGMNFKAEYAYVKQNQSRPFFKTVKSYIYDEVKNKSNSNKSIDSRVNNIIKVMDLKPIIDYKVREITPGQFRWVDLAAKIASFPKILFIDEIEMHLSSKDLKSLSKILYRKSSYEGVTIIISTQSKELLRSLSSINISISEGRITRIQTSTNFSKKKKK